MVPWHTLLILQSFSAQNTYFVYFDGFTLNHKSTFKKIHMNKKKIIKKIIHTFQRRSIKSFWKILEIRSPGLIQRSLGELSHHQRDDSKVKMEICWMELVVNTSLG